MRISLADAATAFVAQALDLLVAVEQSDPMLVTDDALAHAEAFRRLIDAGGW